ncbi:dTDP-4-dehydrorhamnose reductase [Novosphingobium sp.]|uniref:dTDP-4-dehydrorhamnose reductase n=1 Tax=Novosphingobium sp. TaxID=1874826 RepID=UPI00263141C2|nr:dTDP-4-dehydrorhamnose reductase [Novosphingobium sp.]
MRICVTGLQGQVVQSLLARGAGLRHTVIPVGRPLLDLSKDDPVGVHRTLAQARPDVVVSAAAYTAVDQAESDREAAFAVNVRGAGLVARATAAMGVPLIHMSTDYVFSGTASTPYRESDVPDPQSIYGATKLAGEYAVLAENSNTAVLRTAWVISPFGRNFVRTMLALAATRDELSVVSDQVGNPTCAMDIADAVLAIAGNLVASNDAGLRGIFHLAGAGETSWAGLAEAVFRRSSEIGGPVASVRHIRSDQYPTAARRPANSRLNCTNLAASHRVRMPNWYQSLPKTVDALVQERLKLSRC